MYADTRTPSMEPQWLAAGLSQVSDLGLLWAKKDLAANDILYMVEEINDFKGGMAENYVNVQLSINGYHTYKPAYAIKLSAKNFGFEDNKKIVPLYAAFCIWNQYCNDSAHRKCGRYFLPIKQNKKDNAY